MKDGYINVLKPPGMSSGAVVGLVKRLTGCKCGHAGTLDPEACGVLPVMVGRAARLFDFLVEKQKTYLAECAFGYATDTQDAQGTAVSVGTNYPSYEEILSVLPEFVGDIMQIPPVYSALKQGGRTLYSLAREGAQVDIPARPVQVFGIDPLGETPRHGVLLRIRCGRGTYIRTICHDLGQRLGCPSHMRFLLREQTGAFTLDTAATVEELKAAAEAGMLESMILPPDMPLAHIPRVDLTKKLWKKAVNGVALMPSEWHPEGGEGKVRLYCGGSFIGMSEAEADGTLKPLAVINIGKETEADE